MKTDEDYILQDEKDAMREEMLQDERHERFMRTDLDYFFEHSDFEQLKKTTIDYIRRCGIMVTMNH